MDLPQLDDYRSLFLNNTPLLDVRATIEFSQGAFPFSENFPILNDQERESIGIQYKKLGQQAAIELGAQLVQGEVKQTRVDQWEDFFKRHPQGILYCFRGGMRSKITQQWIYEQTGKVYPRVKGGYKAMRRFLIDQLDASSDTIQPIMLGGRTGIGKTVLLYKLNQQIDLEGIFNHRGSVFGKHVTPQPAPIDIENILSIELLRHLDKGHTNLVFEDEAPNIGSRKIPEVLFNKMKQSPLILLEASVEDRINVSFNEYVTEALAEHQAYYGEEQGITSWSNQLHESFDKIQRRLGGVRYKEFKSKLSEAIEALQNRAETNQLKEWIKNLLIDYYDPMYDFQLSKKQDRVVFKGQQNEVLEYLQQTYSIS